MDRFAQDLLKALPRAFESEEYAQRRAETVKKAEEEQRALIQQATEMARKKGFTIQASPQGMQLVPIKSGLPFIGNMTSPQDDVETERRRAELEQELRQSLRPLIEIGRSTEEAMDKLNKEVVGNAVGPLLTEPRETFKDNPKVFAYLNEVMADVLENLRPVAPTDPAPADAAAGPGRTAGRSSRWTTPRTTGSTCWWTTPS